MYNTFMLSSGTMRVGIVRGGSSKYGYQKSMNDGSILLRALKEHIEYEPVDVFIDQSEIWHVDGVPIPVNKLVHNVDMCINTITNPLQKLGFVETIIKSFGIPCIFAPKESLRGYIPEDLSRKLKSIGIHIPNKSNIDLNDPNAIKNIHLKFSPPYIVNFANPWGQVDTVVNTTKIDELKNAIENHYTGANGKYYSQEFINGDEWAVTVIPNFRDLPWYTLHPIYVQTIAPAFRETAPVSKSAIGQFANPVVRNTLDLYARLVAGNLKTSVPLTMHFVYRDERRPPSLVKIIERHTLDSDESLLHALNENAISHKDFIHMLIQNKRP